MEDGETERLSLRVSPQVCLKAEGIDGRYEGLDGVQWGTRNGSILGHMTPGREREGMCKSLTSGLIGQPPSLYMCGNGTCPAPSPPPGEDSVHG